MIFRWPGLCLLLSQISLSLGAEEGPILDKGKPDETFALEVAKPRKPSKDGGKRRLGKPTITAFIPWIDKTLIMLDWKTDDFPKNSAWTLFDSWSVMIDHVEFGEMTRAEAWDGRRFLLSPGPHKFIWKDSIGDGLTRKGAGYRITCGAGGSPWKLAEYWGTYDGVDMGQIFEERIEQFVVPDVPKVRIILEIRLDEYSEETGWTIGMVDFPGGIVAERKVGHYAGNDHSVVKETIEIEKDRAFKFTIHDSWGDGLWSDGYKITKQNTAIASLNIGVSTQSGAGRAGSVPEQRSPPSRLLSSSNQQYRACQWRPLQFCRCWVYLVL